MKGIRKVLLGCAALLLVWMVPSQSYANGQPDVFGQYAVSIDAKTGDVLYDKNSAQRAYPASMTKVLTGILLLENAEPGEQIVFSKEALEQEKSNYQIEFQEGEAVDRDTALNIMMIISANDVSYAIAEHVAGSVEEFAKLMNEKAKQLGAKDSHFVTPNGLHHPDHYTTPYDMAMITRGALRHPELLEAMITKRTTVTTSLQSKSIFNKARYFEDPNYIGGKTGYTDAARNTLVLIGKKDENTIINVVMASVLYEIYNDMKLISDYSFPLFAKQTVLQQEEWSKEITFLDKPVQAGLERSSDVVLKQGEAKNVEVRFAPLHIDYDHLYEKGIRTGDLLGKVNVMKNGNVIDSVPVLSTEDVAFEKPLEQKITSSFPITIPIIVFLVLSGLGLSVRRLRR